MIGSTMLREECRRAGNVCTKDVYTCVRVEEYDVAGSARRTRSSAPTRKVGWGQSTCLIATPVELLHHLIQALDKL